MLVLKYTQLFISVKGACRKIHQLATEQTQSPNYHQTQDFGFHLPPTRTGLRASEWQRVVLRLAAVDGAEHLTAGRSREPLNPSQKEPSPLQRSEEVKICSSRL